MTYTRGYLAHASISPSCGLAVYRDGTLTVWTHCQGVYPLRAALAKVLKSSNPPRSLFTTYRDRAATVTMAPTMPAAGHPIRAAPAPRGRVHLRAENAGHDRQGPCLARRCRQARRLDAGNLKFNPQSTAGRRRKPARRARAAHSTAAETMYPKQTAAAPHATPSRSTTFPPSGPPGDGSAGANLGAARGRGNANVFASNCIDELARSASSSMQHSSANTFGIAPSPRSAEVRTGASVTRWCRMRLAGML